MDPLEESISTLVSMGICDIETAKRYLRAKNNSVEQAAAALLDGEDITATETSGGWDEGVWATDRSGKASDGDPDRNLHPLATSTAPTRGPSPAGSYRRPGTRAEEDEDLAMAMAASQNDLRYGEQETGVIGSDGTTTKTHGPQQADYYKQSQWAMVKFEPTTSEVVPDVDAVGRRHVLGEPRFLKNTVHGDYLPNFLTICHNIPAARELLLMSSYARHDYGQNPEWWKGQQIVLPKVVHTADASPTDPMLARYDDFLAEIQRLMAFLDSSDRTYASTAGLETTAGLSRHGRTAKSSTQTNIETFISELTAAAHSVSESAELVEHMFGLQAGSSDGSIDSRVATVLDFAVESVEKVTDLSELLDRTLWDTETIEDEPEDRYIERLPEVMVMRVKQHNPDATATGVSAPGHLYMDKYVQDNVEAIRPLRERMSRERQRVQKISDVEERLRKWKSQKHNITVNASKLLSQTKVLLSSNANDTTSSPDETMVNGITRSHEQELAEKLDQIISNIEEKLVILDQERTKAIEVLAELSSPTHARSLLGDLEHHFTLVGIATKPNITYVLRPKEESSDEQMPTDDQGDNETPQTMQWWRIEYSLNGTKASIDRGRFNGFDALPAVQHEHTSALLVYASDAALDQRLVADFEPSDALQNFVKTDNTFFEEELRALPPPSYGFDDIDAMPSIEQRRNSVDSTRAEGGSDIDMDQDPTQHANFGLGYGASTQYDDQPLVEIKLPDEGLPSSESGADGSALERTDRSWDTARPDDGKVKW